MGFRQDILKVFVWGRGCGGRYVSEARGRSVWAGVGLCERKLLSVSFPLVAGVLISLSFRPSLASFGEKRSVYKYGK